LTLVFATRSSVLEVCDYATQHPPPETSCRASHAGDDCLRRGRDSNGAMHTRDRQIVKQWGYVRSYVIKDVIFFLSLMADGGIYEFEPFVPTKPNVASELRSADATEFASQRDDLNLARRCCRRPTAVADHAAKATYTNIFGMTDRNGASITCDSRNVDTVYMPSGNTAPQ
jgi:hypothetical protein